MGNLFYTLFFNFITFNKERSKISNKYFIYFLYNGWLIK